MTLGEWRDGFPHVTLTLVSERGPSAIDFIVDTGFNGDLALPEIFVAELGLSPTGTHYVELAGNPLIGNGLWQGFLLQAENARTGEVTFEAL